MPGHRNISIDVSVDIWKSSVSERGRIWNREAKNEALVCSGFVQSCLCLRNKLGVSAYFRCMRPKL